MALLDVNSPLVLNAGLDLFKVPPTDVSSEQAFYEDYLPTASLDTSQTITFIIPKQFQHYIDLANTVMYVKCKIINKDGTDLTDKQDVTLVNNGLHSLFSYLEITFNDVQIDGPISNSYAYLAYIKRLLYESENVKKVRGGVALYLPEMKKRLKITNLSKIFEMTDNIFADIFQQEKYLIPGIEMKLKFQKNIPAFSLLTTLTPELQKINLPHGAEIKILDMYIRLHKINVHSQLQMAHETMLRHGKTANYVIDKSLFKYVQIEKGATNHRVENVFYGYIPPQFMLFFVDANAYNGDIEKDPFAFNDFNIAEVTVYVNNVILTNKALQMDFANNRYLEAYSSFLQNIGTFSSNDFTNGIGLDDYKKDKAIFFFNTTPDSAAEAHFDLIKNGNIRLEISFHKPLDSPINAILIASKPTIVKIDSNRNIAIES